MDELNGAHLRPGCAAALHTPDARMMRAECAGSGATVRKSAWVLILRYPDDGDNRHNLEAIRPAYITAFAQASVMRVDGGSCVS